MHLFPFDIQVDNDSDRIQEAPTNISCAFYAPRGRENPKELVPHPQPAKFFALGAQFDVIQGLCNQDLRFKVSPQGCAKGATDDPIPVTEFRCGY